MLFLNEVGESYFFAHYSTALETPEPKLIPWQSSKKNLAMYQCSKCRTWLYLFMQLIQNYFIKLCHHSFYLGELRVVTIWMCAIHRWLCNKKGLLRNKGLMHDAKEFRKVRYVQIWVGKLLLASRLLMFWIVLLEECQKFCNLHMEPSDCHLELINFQLCTLECLEQKITWCEVKALRNLFTYIYKFGAPCIILNDRKNPFIFYKIIPRVIQATKARWADITKIFSTALGFWLWSIWHHNLKDLEDGAKGLRYYVGFQLRSGELLHNTVQIKLLLPVTLPEVLDTHK